MKRLVILLALFAFIFNANAQQVSEKMNTIKFNFTPLLLRTFSFQYERVLKPKLSVLMHGGYTLPIKVPTGFYSGLDSLNTGNSSGKYTRITGGKFNGGFQLTPEVRFYPAGNANKGFYLAGYLRYNNLGVTATVDHRDDSIAPIMRYNYKGTYAFTSVGVMIGYQWFLGDNFTFDWWLLGFNAGSGKVKMEADGDFSTIDKVQYINDINLNLTGPFIRNLKASIISNNASLQFSVPGFGVRSGLSLGYRF